MVQDAITSHTLSPTSRHMSPSVKKYITQCKWVPVTCQNVKVIVVLHRVLHREDCLPTSEEIHIEAKLKDDRVELPSSLNVEENLNA